MNGNEKIVRADLNALEIVKYPASCLREPCTPIETVDDSVRVLVERMFALMFSARGVGLAAPQVGITARLFVASPTFEASDRRVYINPQIVEVEGDQDGEEGCLSFPNIACPVRRHQRVIIRAQGLDGAWFEEAGEGLTARIFEHESDHLDGRLLVDRMGSVAKLSNRRALRDLEEAYVPASR